MIPLVRLHLAAALLRLGDACTRLARRCLRESNRPAAPTRNRNLI